MSDFTIETEGLADGVVRLQLARAPVNALSAPFLDAFGETLDGLVRDASCSAILLSSPYKVFSAGLDLKEARGFDIPAQNEIVRALNQNFLKLFACPKPTVAAVNGAAIAGGLFFVLGADWRVGAPGAQLGLAEVRVGADFPVGPLEIARASLDDNTLRRLMLTGQPMPAEEAERRGVLDAVAAPEALAETAEAKARELAALPPLTFAAIKAQVRTPAIARIEAAMAAGANASESGWFSSETAAAMDRMIG